MKAFKKFMFLLLAGALVFTGCSRKKDTFLNRNWHAVTTEYNTLYNGNLALDLGKQELNETYSDNYWTILPVERMQIREEVLLPETQANPNFKIAEEKATKAIQRHSMLLDGREKNPQIDEAYLLLGKARYYDQRFIPALEAFNYILHKYPLSNTINEARIWREKANIRLEFEELAIKNLKKILEEENLGTQNRADASAMLAEAYINFTYLDSAVASIRTAAEFTKNNDEKGRYLFIKGQLFNELGMRDSANLAFEEVIDLNRKTPRIYMINAHIARTRNMAANADNKAAFLEFLTDMEQDRENRPFLDKIYFQLAEFHYQMDSVELAMNYYNRSLRSPSDDTYLQSLDYQTLGNIHFDAANYKMAGAYYDSTLLRLPENTREFRLIKKKRDNLQDVIIYEDLARKNDSILFLADMTEDERLDFFMNYTHELRQRAEGKGAVAENAPVQVQPSADPRTTARKGMPGVPNPGNSFYFYNNTAVAYGKQEFFRIWGNRELRDNWRTGGTGNLQQNTVVDADLESTVEDNPLYDPQRYISQIPEDPEVLDSIERERNLAWYQLGIIYREKFKEDAMAAEKLELLLQSNPEERLVLPSRYNLYKIHSEAGNLARAQSLKNDIVQQYPDSRYAAILQNPGKVVQDENSPEAIYNELYSLFEKQEYEEVISRTRELTEKYTGDQITPKFELLGAMATGRLLGFEAYKKALNEVALNYPQSEEGKKAQQLYTEALPVLANQSFQQDTIADSFKLIFPFEKERRHEAEEFQEKLQKSIEESGYTNLKVSKDVYNPNRLFVVVHGFRSSHSANNFTALLSEDKKYETDRNYFYISTPNYRVVQIHKNVESYLSNLTNTPQ